ncbi:DMT family transporter [Rhizobacter sp. OV335]|uniref:DMT family transporter n=1 Tax=Rhizobacter sp. OV335 TaxID=1500264 RepID=UPI000915FF71|nr:DMT family transporter [Rhizobacter sp. OV335]SHM36386.1 Threonine/homoserine efflux transporter RhtA [Rhizobacter sp. OV335]
MTATIAASPPWGPPNTSIVYAKLVMVALFWGGTFIAGKELAQAMPPAVAAVLRFGVAVLLLLPLAWRSAGGLPRLSWRQCVATAGLGLTGIFLYNLCFFSALARMPAGRTALFVALNPVVTAVAASLVFRERLRPLQWWGIALALTGAVVVITRGSPLAALHDISRSIGTGELLMFGAVLSWAAYTVIGRVAFAGLSPLVATTWAALWGLSFLLLGSAGEWADVAWRQVAWPVWAAVVYLGAFGTVLGFVWYGEGVKAIGPSRTVVFNNLVPVFGVALASLLLGETITASMGIGGALSVLGVMLTNRKR